MKRFPARGFTLIELMVASAIAAIIGLAAASLAGAMARQVRQVEEQGDIGARTAIAHDFFSTTLDGIGYNWKVEDYGGNDILSGSPGQARCHDTAAPGICTGGAGATRTIRPLEVCASNGLDLSTCNAPNPGAGSAIRADGIRAVVPRDPLGDAVRIVDKNPAFASGNCNAANVGDPQQFQVQGAHAQGWAVGDYVLIAGRQHANVGILTAALASENNPDDINLMTISVGDVTGLDMDDDGYDDGDVGHVCDAQVSFVGARVIRIKRVLIRLNEATRTLELLEKSTTAAASFVPVLTDVDDFQVQLVSNRLVAGGAYACVSEGMDGGAARINNVLYNRGNLGGACPNNDPLARDSDPVNNADDDIVRISGLRIGLLMGSGAQTLTFPRAWNGVFDNAGRVLANDRRVRRPLVFFVGLPNASAY